MGIQDRDYMRERHRKAAFGSEARRDSPFTPPSEGPSMLVMVLTWVSIAFLLYRGYTWLEHKHHSGGGPTVNSAVVTNTRPTEATPDRASIPNRFAAPHEVVSSAPMATPSAPPPVQYRPHEEQRREAPVVQTSGTIYLCRAYNGGSFWSQAHCGQHQALIDRIVSVPAGLPFQQQVELAEQQRSHVVSTVSTTTIQVNGESASSHAAECKSLDARVEQLDAQARQPQSGAVQDWLRGQRQEARDRQFALHC